MERKREMKGGYRLKDLMAMNVSSIWYYMSQETDIKLCQSYEIIHIYV